ncbi:hypothetical protein [Nocardiopsis sp. YSL2]|uniref:hypothetical protein n=1 Tax=Nocardiopsis sp. YSL2 TaxID=2939492 RepID=UPI0026F46D28|nr:hypothetical protein [Nocardiopsis sp. YSL2]
MSTPDRPHIDPTEQYDLLHQMGIALLGKAPDNWHEIVYTTNRLVGYGTHRPLVRFADDSSEVFSLPPEILSKEKKLREAMYQEGKGTWFSMIYRIVRPGKFTTEFNYDNPPEFTIPPNPSSYAADLEYFPRDPEHIPDWLQEQLRRAETEED